MVNVSEFVLGGLAACGACVFTNPLEVVKTRIQLQGELRARGQYTVHYRNVFHAFYTIGSTEGLLALHKGFTPAILHQFFMNGVRLGVFQSIENTGLTRNSSGEPILGRTVFAGAIAGASGAFVASPFYLIKTHLQAKSNSVIAVGYQHPHETSIQAAINIIKSEGLTGLWRGSTAATVRVTMGSAVQLTTFTQMKSFLHKYTNLKNESWLNSLASAMCSGGAVALGMTPFDVVSTRLYNQPVDPVTRKGLTYKGMTDCAWKIFSTEGPLGFYKGGLASFFRIGPHTILSLLFWRELRKLYFSLDEKLKSQGDDTRLSTS